MIQGSLPPLPHFRPWPGVYIGFGVFIIIVGLFTFWLSLKNSPSLCVDSDASEGQEAIYIKGMVSGKDNQGRSFINADICASQSAKLYEFSCQQSFLVSQGIHECPFGCVDGACLRQKNSSIPPAPGSLPLHFVPLIEWLSPNDSLTVERGSAIPLAWSIVGESAQKHIQFSLSTPGVQTQTEIFLASELKGSFPVRVPPGSYTLQLTFPDGESKVEVQVTGPVPTISSEDSYLAFDDVKRSRGTIIANGVCAIKLGAHILDKYGYGIGGSKVILTSSRMGIDVITPRSFATNQNGEARFVVTSKFPGTSHLSARADKTDLSGSLMLDVLDPKASLCPEANRQD